MDFENKIVNRFFNHESFENQFKLTCLFNFLYFPIFFIVIPILFSFLGEDFSFVALLLGGLFGLITFPFSVYSFVLLILSFFIDYTKIFYRKNIFYSLYAFWVIYLAYSTTTDDAGGFLIKWWFEYIIPQL